MKKLTDKELKQEYESMRGQWRLFRVSLILGGIGAAAFVTLLFDPFGWLGSAPAVHEAKKWIALCIFFVLIPGLMGIWFLIIQPLLTGVVPIGVRSRPRLILRSEEPFRFRFNVLLNCLKVAGTLTLGGFMLASFIRDLQKAQTAEPKEMQQTGARSRP